ncbi:heme-binding protein [Ectothiorhodospira sp. A-7Y]|nr:heme-binding protein [Ectothiorhodospira lacustris]MCG5501020.1 heme-binding protein [Ectothiorhodospira lacustris]MCG5508878.1 heme-binding protein [Ectothiorhodospira lacustris]MCG5520669.1 heme-binding protein [Ectothiorhodospira lacustris]
MKLPATLAAGALTLCLAAVPIQADEAPVTMNIKVMTLDTASRLAWATLEACREAGVNVAVTVVDRGGNTQVVLRDTLAVDLTLAISRQKAYTAMSFNGPLSEMEDRFTKPFQVGKVDGVVFSAGGLPIHAAGRIIGGIGVSGAPSGETDEMCARQGLDEIRMDLEMVQP